MRFRSSITKPYTLIIITTILFIILYFAYRWGEYSKNALVIVEPREHHLLKYVIDNFDKAMDHTWDLYVFHGSSESAKKYAEFATEAARALGRRKIFLIPLQVNNLNADQYNELFKSSAFWDQVWAENILVFQTDTAICGTQSPHKMREFMKYDYIGCAGGKTEIGKGAYWGKKYSFYGVGGLSFRKKSFMKKCIAARPGIKPAYAEDVFFSECLDMDADAVKPESAEVLNAFCSQNAFHAPSFGAHKTRNMSAEDKKRFYKYCPVAQALEVA